MLNIEDQSSTREQDSPVQPEGATASATNDAEAGPAPATNAPSGVPEGGEVPIQEKTILEVICTPLDMLSTQQGRAAAFQSLQTFIINCTTGMRMRHRAEVMSIDTSQFNRILRVLHPGLSLPEPDSVRKVIIAGAVSQAVFNLLVSRPLSFWNVLTPTLLCLTAYALLFTFLMKPLAVSSPRNNARTRALIYCCLTACRLDRRPPTSMLGGAARELRRMQSTDRPSMSHPSTSSTRNVAVEQIEYICQRLGVRPYYHLMSRRIRERPMVKGSTYTYGIGSEFNDPYLEGQFSDDILDDHAIVMVDRDYHVDMNKVLTLAQPVILFTFEPVLPCYNDGELTYSFDSEGNLVGGVPGAEPWKHQLWDYPDDKVRVNADGVTTHYKVLKWRIGPTSPRVIVLLYPISQTLEDVKCQLTRMRPVSGRAIVLRGRITTHYSTVGSTQCWSIDTTTWDTVVSDVLARSLNTAIPAISRPAITQCLIQLEYEDQKDVIASQLWSTIRLCDLSKMPECQSTRYATIIGVDHERPEPRPAANTNNAPNRPHDHDVIDRGTLGGNAEAGPSSAGGPTHEAAQGSGERVPFTTGAEQYPLGGGPEKEEVRIRDLPVPPQVASIDSTGRGMTDGFSHGASTLATPLIYGGSFPAVTLQNALQSVEWRMRRPQEASMNATANVDEKYYAYAAEFISAIKEHATREGMTFPLIPFDEEYVAEHQDKPSQRQQQAEAASMPLRNFGQSTMFPKKEHGAILQTSDSRAIVTETIYDKCQLARYTYALAEVFKKQPWYAFGQSCASVANRVAEICRFCSSIDIGVAMTDYNRFDGTVNAFVRWSVMELYRGCYSTGDMEEVNRLLERRMNVEVVAKHEGTRSCLGFFFRYLSGCSLLSGDPNTSIIGSFFNAFLAYCHHRENNKTHEEAMRLLGIYGGDDGVTPVENIDVYKRVAAELGMSLDAQMHSARSFEASDPETYVKFLSRVYSPLVWNGSPDSCCSFLRTASKLTYSTHTDRKATRLVQKCQSLLINDPNTPVLSDYSRAVTRTHALLTGSDLYLPETLHELKAIGLNWWACTAQLTGGAFPNENADGWIEAYIMSEVPELDISNFRADLLAAWDRTLTTLESLREVWEQHKSEGNRAHILESALRHIASVTTGIHITPKPKPGQIEEIVGNGEHVVIRDDTAPNRVGEHKPDVNGVITVRPDVDTTAYSKHKVMGSYVINGEIPFKDLTPGTRKCLFVNAFMCSQDIVPKPKRVMVIYSGAYNPTTMNTFVSLVRHSYPSLWKIMLIDPMFTTSKYYTTRGSKVSIHEFPLCKNRMLKLLSNDDSRGEPGDVIWFDDVSRGEDDYRMFWDLKMDLMETIGDRLAACTLKIRAMEGPLFRKPTPGAIFQTPSGYPGVFTDVSELRFMYTRNHRSNGIGTPTISDQETYQTLQERYRIPMATALQVLDTAERIVNADKGSYILPDDPDNSHRGTNEEAKPAPANSTTTVKRETKAQGTWGRSRGGRGRGRGRGPAVVPKGAKPPDSST